MFKTMHRWVLLGWVLTNFEQVKEISSYFSDFEQVKRISRLHTLKVNFFK